MSHINVIVRAARQDHALTMAKKFPLNPSHPERVCWGCDRYCPADALCCGNGTERTQHPAEIFGEDWAEWGLDPVAPRVPAAAESPIIRGDRPAP